MATMQRGIRVLIDLVVNHTSNEHPWFQDARRDPKSRYRDRCVWSKRHPPHELPAPLFPEQLPEGAEYDRLIQRALSNEIIHGKLPSKDGELTLIVLVFDPDVVSSSRLRDVIANIRKTIDDDLAGTGLTVRLSRVPVMQLEIRNAVERDRLLYNAFGFADEAVIVIVFFRRL